MEAKPKQTFSSLGLTIDVAWIQEWAKVARDKGNSDVAEIAIYVAGDAYPLRRRTFTAVEFLRLLGFEGPTVATDRAARDA